MEGGGNFPSLYQGWNTAFDRGDRDGLSLGETVTVSRHQHGDRAGRRDAL